MSLSEVEGLDICGGVFWQRRQGVQFRSCKV
jgi:hypothetical protein